MYKVKMIYDSHICYLFLFMQENILGTSKLKVPEISLYVYLYHNMYLDFSNSIIYDIKIKYIFYTALKSCARM